MKLKYQFELVNMGDETIAVPVGKTSEQLRGVIKLNNTGAELFALLQDNISESAMIKYIGEKYSNDKQGICKYIHAFIDQLRSLDLILE